MNKSFKVLFQNSLFFIISLCAIALHAQNKKNNAPKIKLGADISFDSKKHNYGELDETMMFASYRFSFTNTGDAPLFINKVESSCGCTSPSWTLDSIPPGGKGYVETRYETSNHLGQFHKTVTVYTNVPKTPFVYLDIEGNVIRPKATFIGAPTPQSIGSLVFEKGAVIFEPLYDNSVDSQYIKLTNTTLYTTNFTPINPDDLPPYCKILDFPSSLEPNEFAKIKVIIDGKKAPGYGFGAFQVPIFSDNVVLPAMGLSITYKRSQYFPKYSAKELAKQPKIEIAKPMHDFGPQTSGDYLFCNFDIKNTGKKELVIKQIMADCPCFRFKQHKNTIAPGETLTLEAIFDTVTKNGAKTIGCEIVTNDPINPSKYIYVKAQFQEKFSLKCPTCD
jgi:hypothetical protein